MAWTTPKTWVAAEVVTAANMNTHIRDNLEVIDFFDHASWTPTLSATVTPPTLSDDASHEVVGRKLNVGDQAWAWCHIKFGTSGTAAGDGTYQIATPWSATSDYNLGTDGQVIGSGRLYDNDLQDTTTVTWHLSSVDLVRARYTSATIGLVTHAAPHTWADSDYLSFQWEYETA